MVLATMSLSAVALSVTMLLHLLLPDFARGNVAGGFGPSDPATPYDMTSVAPSPPLPPLSELSVEEDQEAFLELVKRRASIQTPLDASFWRPYNRMPSEHPPAKQANGTKLFFVAGAEGTGHHFITALLMRLPELMPMSLVQEQMFQALWWDPKQHDPAVFWSAVEVVAEWVRNARSAGKHPAFCARTCLRLSGQRHCSWISGMQQQAAGRLLDGKGHNGSFQPVGQMFSYPFSRSANETEDSMHYPELNDLSYMADLLGLKLKVVVLYRSPVDAIMSMNTRGLPKIWRRAGRTFKLHKQVSLFLSQLDELHSQLGNLRSDEYRVVNYTDVLANPSPYAAPLAEFLELSFASVSRSFVLSIKAKPKRRMNASAPMDGGTVGSWSDEIRRNFIESRLQEARSSATPPQCCDEWVRHFERTPVVRVPQVAPPRRQRHWFSRWAAEAPPPLRAANISFTHVVNPFAAGDDSEHSRAQQTTLASIAHSAALASSLGVRVDVVCVMFPEDVPKVTLCEQYGFKVVTLNVSAHTTLPQFKHPVRLPFLNMILHAGYQHGEGYYLTYSNIDIGVQAPFYIKLARQLQLMPNLPITVIREEFEHVPEQFGVEQALGWRGTGLAHPGHDCWTFPRAWVPQLTLGFTMIGVSMIATDLMQALHARSGCRMALLSPKLTFHFVTGESVVKHPGNQRARNDRIFTGLYTAWNCVQFANNRRDILARHPEYAQCWFSQQAEWSVYGYGCGATIEHLPHEYKLLWHNNSALNVKATGRASCNLPTICSQCRGKDGTRRLAADLMSPVPCGFCRCAGDTPPEYSE